MIVVSYPIWSVHIPPLWLSQEEAEQSEFETPSTEELENMPQDERRQFLRQKAKKSIRYEKNKANPDHDSIESWQRILKSVSKERSLGPWIIE